MRKNKKNKAIIITGPSGAGKTSAINVLEDVGFEPIDNIPIELMGNLLLGTKPVKPIAVGVDVRTRGFSAENLLKEIDILKENPGVQVKLLYLDCQSFELEKRYNGTRRRHPLSTGNTLNSAIYREKKEIEPLREKADILLDTSQLNPNQLKLQLIKSLSLEPKNYMSITIQSFSYRKPMPPSVDMLFDCRFLRNPYWIPELRKLTGKDLAVARQIEKDENWEIFFRKTVGLLEFLLPRYKQEGKTYFFIGFGCSGGQHRSVFTSDRIARELEKLGWAVTVDHRELEGKDN